MSATVCQNDGDTHNAPCEQTEVKFPVLIRRHALRQDFGRRGPVPRRLGAEKVVEPRCNVTVGTQMERVNCPPWGCKAAIPARATRSPW